MVGGAFSSINGTPRNYLARLNRDTGLLIHSTPAQLLEVDTTATQPDGRFIVGGKFGSISSTPRNAIARFDNSGTLDGAFNPNVTLNGNPGSVYSIAVQADDQVWVGASFISVNGQVRNCIARVNGISGASGAPDSQDPNASGGEVDSIATQPDGKILIGGAFDHIGIETRNALARLTNTTPALQNLAVTQTDVIWSRGGASPQLTRVTFEYSTDNVNYIPLGNGTFTGSSWTLTGLNLLTGENIYIRARAYYGGGLHNASESITESIRDAFIPMPVTIAMPMTTVDTNTSNFIQPVTASIIAATYNLTGFQGDLIFDSTVVSFQNPPVTATGLTASNWTVSANVLPGGGPTRTLHLSASSNTMTPLSGAGTLFNFYLSRVSNTPGTSCDLMWAASPNDFAFLDTGSNRRAPNSVPPGRITIAAPTISISGAAVYCSNPSLNPVTGVTMTLSGSATRSTLSDGSGKLQL